MRTLLEHKEEDYYKPKRVSNNYIDNYSNNYMK